MVIPSSFATPKLSRSQSSFFSSFTSAFYIGDLFFLIYELNKIDGHGGCRSFHHTRGAPCAALHQATAQPGPRLNSIRLNLDVRPKISLSNAWKS